MKKLLRVKILQSTFIAVSSLLVFNAAAQPIPEMLHYNFDGTGTTVPNLASNPPAGTATATIMGGVTQGSTGMCGGALVGSGTSASSDYLNTGFVTAMPSSWTISFWCQGISTNTTLYYIFGDGTANSFRCFTNGVAGSGNWILRATGMSDIYINGGADGNPHVCTYVYDGTANAVYGYLDGVLVSTVAQGAPLALNGTGPFKVMGYNTNVGAPAGGRLDEFRMYDRALSAAEVLELQSAATYYTETASECESYFWQETATTYTTSGQYTAMYAGSNGCDSVRVLDLTITGPSYGPTETMTACDSYFWNGLTYTASGMYYDTLTGQNGCDSILALDLTVNYSPTAFDVFTVCDSYTWPTDGNTYTTSGTYYYTVPFAPCDSVYTLVLTVNESTSSTITETAIDSYTSPGGTTYTTSGVYTDVIPNAAGCDSTITINLTVEYTGINELTSANYVAYPNPADDQIHIEGIETIAGLRRVYITTISGTLALEVLKPLDTIHVGDLQTGAYFLNIESEQGQYTIRFVKE